MRIFSAIILFFLTFAAVCSEKIALASYGRKAENAAELFLARFSGEYEFVERSSFAMLRNEQNLQQEYGLSLLSRRLKPVGADIFMAFEELPENQLRVSIFESDYGFRLQTKNIPADNFETIRRLLEKAQEQKRNPEKTHMISIAGFRNNLPYASRAEGHNMRKLLLNELYQMNAVWLEREYLIELLREKQLSGQWGKAVAASEVLHIEFNPGETEDNFVISAYLTDSSERMIFRHTYKNTDSPETLFEKLRQYLILPHTAKHYDIRKEAVRFDREARIAAKNRDYIDAVKLGFAAFALNPGKAKYLKAYYSESIFPAAYPYYRAALEYFFENQTFLNNIDAKMSIHHLLSIIKTYSASLSEQDQKDFWHYIAQKRELLLQAGNDDTLPSEMNRFANLHPSLYPTNEEYLKILQSAWQSFFDFCRTGTKAETRKIWSDSVMLNLLLLHKLTPHETRLIENCRELARSNPENCSLLPAVLELHKKYLERKPNAELSKEYANYRKNAEKLQLPVVPVYIFEQHVEPQKRIKTPQKSEIQPSYQQVLWKTNSNAEILASCFETQTQTLYFLTYDAFDHIVMKLGPNDQLSQVATFPLEQHGKPANYTWIMASDGESVAVTNSAMIYAGREDILTAFHGFPFRIRTLAIHEGRIYLAGDRILMSCDIYGGSRETHISASQTEKTLSIQSLQQETQICSLNVSKDQKKLQIELKSPFQRTEYSFDFHSKKIIRLRTSESPQRPSAAKSSVVQYVRGKTTLLVLRKKIVKK